MAEKKRGTIGGSIRIPLDSLLFHFNVLALPSISSKSLKFRPVLYCTSNGLKFYRVFYWPKHRNCRETLPLLAVKNISDPLAKTPDSNLKLIKLRHSLAHYGALVLLGLPVLFRDENW
jgi:hypothetical protein